MRRIRLSKTLRSMKESSMWLNRTVCDVLEEMRALNRTVNARMVDAHKEQMAYLIEEVQSMANRMEAKLEDIRDFDKLTKDIKELSKKKKELENEVD